MHWNFKLERKIVLEKKRRREQEIDIREREIAARELLNKILIRFESSNCKCCCKNK